MQRLGKISLIGLAFITVLMSSCREDVQFPIIPAVEFNSFVVFEDSASIVFDITDGDGNFGLAVDDTLGNFELSIDPFNKFYYCIFVDPYILNNNVWEFVDLAPSAANPGASPLYYRTKQRFDPTGSDKNLEAEIRVSLEDAVWPPADFESGDTIKFEIHIADRDLQESNRVETPVFIIP